MQNVKAYDRIIHKGAVHIALKEGKQCRCCGHLVGLGEDDLFPLWEALRLGYVPETKQV
jgi:hypothetical protein